jgi:hypothetical protein
MAGSHPVVALVRCGNASSEALGRVEGLEGT